MFRANRVEFECACPSWCGQGCSARVRRRQSGTWCPRSLSGKRGNVATRNAASHVSGMRRLSVRCKIPAVTPLTCPLRRTSVLASFNQSPPVIVWQHVLNYLPLNRCLASWRAELVQAHKLMRLQRLSGGAAGKLPASNLPRVFRGVWAFQR